MESDGEGLENIFEEEENDRGAENQEVTNETPGVRVPVPKRIVKNPRLKFNPERLCGERGIPILADHFKDIKFKGIGHEKEDLDKLLTKLEHWTHRLFPSMKFEDCLLHIEKLGKKRPVQTCLRKLRMNMPVLSSDFVKDDEEDVPRIEDSEPVEIDAFDRLIGERQDLSSSRISAPENIADVYTVHSPPMNNASGRGQILGMASESSLTEEQRERMERNRLLAAERRKSRLGALQQSSCDVQVVDKENVSSQNIINTHGESFDSPDINHENAPSTADDLFTKLSSKESISELSNQNSENLGLDDLMDLMDEGDPGMDKSTTSFSSGVPQINSSSLEQTIDVNMSSNTNDDFSNWDKSREFHNDVVPQINSSSLEPAIDISTLKNPNDDFAVPEKIVESEENLEMDSLLDLVDEESEEI